MWLCIPWTMLEDGTPQHSLSLQRALSRNADSELVSFHLQFGDNSQLILPPFYITICQYVKETDGLSASARSAARDDVVTRPRETAVSVRRNTLWKTKTRRYRGLLVPRSHILSSSHSYRSVHQLTSLITPNLVTTAQQRSLTIHQPPCWKSQPVFASQLVSQQPHRPYFLDTCPTRLGYAQHYNSRRVLREDAELGAHVYVPGGTAAPSCCALLED